MGDALLWAEGNLLALGLGLILVLILIVVLVLVRYQSVASRASEHETAKRALEQRVAAMEAAGDAVLVTGSGERFLYSNQAGAELFGYSAPSALFGKTWHSLIADSDADRIDTLVRPTLKKTGRWVGSLRGRTPTGDIIPLDAAFTVVPGGLFLILRNRRAAAEEGDGDPTRFESMVNSAAYPFALLSTDFRIIEWNPEAEHGKRRVRDRGTLRAAAWSRLPGRSDAVAARRV